MDLSNATFTDLYNETLAFMDDIMSDPCVTTCSIVPSILALLTGISLGIMLLSCCQLVSKRRSIAAGRRHR